jgi:hypothetical protein
MATVLFFDAQRQWFPRKPAKAVAPKAAASPAPASSPGAVAPAQ